MRIVQSVEAAVGRRAGVLYAANTVGAVCGSLATGYLLLPHIGMQGSAAVLAGVAVCAIVPLIPESSRHPSSRRIRWSSSDGGGRAGRLVRVAG